jgi:hypothetical protein
MIKSQIKQCGQCWGKMKKTRQKISEELSNRDKILSVC